MSYRRNAVRGEPITAFNKDYLASCDGYYCYYGDQRSVVGSVSYKW
ncbi:hypothetical protein NB855_19445 [Pseudomonas aeruginosa]|nr:hypothetical protein [Pseudomonas aeruginosa]MCZ9724027.1 hypothetical protein [Pseudomonas aeruginosa]